MNRGQPGVQKRHRRPARNPNATISKISSPGVSRPSEPMFARVGDNAGTHDSIRVQLMSAGTPVQIITALEP